MGEHVDHPLLRHPEQPRQLAAHRIGRHFGGFGAGRPELNLPQLEHHGDDAKQPPELLIRKPLALQRMHHRFELGGVVQRLDGARLAQRGVQEGVGVRREPQPAEPRRPPAEEEVEDVEVALARHLVDHPHLLEQVVQDPAPERLAFVVELHLHVLAKARRVVVPDRLGVAKRLQNGVCLEQPVPEVARLASVRRVERQELQNLLRGLRLARARLARDEHALVHELVPHVPVRLVRNGVHVRRQLVQVDLPADREPGPRLRAPGTRTLAYIRAYSSE